MGVIVNFTTVIATKEMIDKINKILSSKVTVRIKRSEFDRLHSYRILTSSYDLGDALGCDFEIVEGV